MEFERKIREFIAMTEQDSGGKRVLTQEQAGVFRSVINSYVAGGIGVLDAGSGCGKSVLILALKKYCDANKISCVVCASTGKAASNIGGVTIHSYIGLSMKPNNNAVTAEDAIKLQLDEKDIEMPDILIVDEYSMIHQQLFNQISSMGFKYVLYVGDKNQARPVRGTKVEWEQVATGYYTLTKTLRASDPRLLKVFDDFRRQKEGELSGLDIFDYVNGDNIIKIDYEDIDKIPTNTDVSFLGYRNKLVEKMSKELASKNHNLYNLNLGVTQTVVRVIREKDGSPKYQDNGYFEREFVNERAFYNGNDVKIEALNGVTQQLVSNSKVNFGKWKLSLSKKGIMITNNEDRIKTGDKEGEGDKYWISFPQPEVLEMCTLSIIDDNVFSLMWDSTLEEFKEMEEYYFQQLLPHLRKYQEIQKHYRKKNCDLNILDYDVRQKVLDMGQKAFMGWYDSHLDTDMRKLGWKNLLNAKSVVSARLSTARSGLKSQGMSLDCVLLGRDSFVGAADDVKYVMVSRMKHGLILIDNIPEWK